MMPSQALLQITTWNVGNIDPSAIGNFSFFDSPLDKAPDIHVFGLQEANRFAEEKWKKALSQLGGDKYTYKKSASINGIVNRSLILLVYVLKSLQNFAFDDTTYATSMTAKGGVSINLRAGRYPGFMSFTAGHLTAANKGKDTLKLRVNDYHAIMDKTKFKSGLGLKDHQFGFFFGDLNFRLANLNASLAIDMIKRSKTTKDKVILDKLFQHDELTQVRLDKRAFYDYIENDPTGFYPTYKMVPGTIDSYNTERVPSWTDRILYRERDINSGFKIKQLYYNSVPQLMNSDHKPVVGIFRVDIP